MSIILSYLNNLNSFRNKITNNCNLMIINYLDIIQNFKLYFITI